MKMCNLIVQVLFIYLNIILFNCRGVYCDSQSEIEVRDLPINLNVNNKNDVNLDNLNYDNLHDDPRLPIFSQSIDLLKIEIDNINDEKCRNHITIIYNNILNVTKWAVKFYDASAKFPEGVLAGSSYQFGNFDECLNIGFDNINSHINNNYGQVPPGIYGKYCLGELTIGITKLSEGMNNTIWINSRKSYERNDNPVTKLHWGICLPSSCSANEIQEVIKRLFNYMTDGTDLILRPGIQEKKCYYKQPLAADFIDIVYISVILTIIVIIIVCTFFTTYYVKDNKEQPKNISMQISNAFSLTTNFKKLCGPGHDNNDLNLNCISGIKFLAMIFIIGGHCLVFIISGPILNMDYWEQGIARIENTIFVNSPLLVDTFLFISGFLFTRILLHELNKRKSVNVFYLYIFRYIRLTPVYLVIVGLYTTWLPKLDSGPLWSRMIEENSRCQTSWWTNIVYINNYFHIDKLCMFQSWYLSVDTQLFIIAPALIYPLWRWQKVGEIILALTTIISAIVPFTVTLVNQLDPTLMVYSSEVEDISSNIYFQSSYIKTHMRATPYCFGIIYGYILYRIQSSNYKFSQISVIAGWISSTFALIFSMYGVVLFYGVRKDFTSIEAAIYSSMHRVLWGLGTGWVIIACVTDNSGPIGKFLRSRVFIVLSRLTYSAYLVNGLVELYGVSTARSPVYLSTINLLSKVLSHLSLTFIGALVLSLMFEAPILGLERILLRPARPRETNNPTKSREDTSTTEA